MKQNRSYSKTLILIGLTIVTNCVSAQVVKKFIDEVDPFVCTGGDHGQLTPSATLPFGLVKVGPETDPTNQAGYNYYSKRIKGFTINRAEGVGCKGAGGNILVKPGFGERDMDSYLYNKSTEKASVGYYEVSFDKPAITAKLTVSNGTGWEKFTYHEAGKAWVMVDLSYSLEQLVEEQHNIIRNGIEGSVQAYSVCKQGIYKFYYHVDIDKKPDSVKTIGSVIWYHFTVKKGENINVKTSVSSISPAQAFNDQKKEVAGLSFEQLKQAAANAWETKLNKIDVEGKDEYVKLFYTHYYHSMLSPSNLSGPSGQFRGSDGKLYKTSDHIYYQNWSIWDNFRTEFPLLTLTEPDVMNDICYSLTELYQQGKPFSATKTEPFLTVRTEHAPIVLLDCYEKGIRKFDLEKVYPFLKQEAKRFSTKTPDQQLESSYDFWALSRIASILNKKEDAKEFALQAAQYKPIWKDKFMIMDDKSDIVGGDGLYEGTIWQYRWFVPYDLEGISAMLGKQQFADQLAYFFDKNLYNHANEPDINVPYLFNFTGKPYLTQKIVNQILTKPMEDDYATHGKFKTPYIGRMYKLTPDGYAPEMDDDAGTMAAWYVLSSIGLYPACVGDPVYFLTSPLFSSVKIKLAGNKVFEIVAKNVSDENYYIESATLNGKKLNRCWLTYQEILNGGKLEYILSNKPSSWANAQAYRSKL